MLLGSKVCFQNLNTHSNATICSITSLRRVFSKMCVFGEGGLKLWSPTVNINALLRDYTEDH